MRWITRAVTVLSIIALSAALAPGASAGRMQSPSLSLSGDASVGTTSTSTARGTKSTDATWVARGNSVHLHAADLDPTLQVTLYKARWTEAQGFTGWEYLYYRGLDATSAGTLSLDEQQDDAGTFRFQVCQYVQVRKGFNQNCSDFAQLEVS